MKTASSRLSRFKFGTCALTLATLCTTTQARANGRFPNALQLREPQPGFLVLSGTYGLLVSGNAGKDFQFVCESTLFGKPSLGSWLDPLLETLSDGSVFSGSQNGLRISRDRGCTFATAFDLPSDPSFVGAPPSADSPLGTVVDVCPGYDGARSVVALATAQASDGSVIEHRLYKTTDGGGAWHALAKPIDKTALRVVLTVDVAPSKPTRIYVSGSNAFVSTLAVSDDGGASYATYPLGLDDSDAGTGAYIAAVSPTNPDRLYVRVSRRSLADDGSDTWDDSLLVSDDAGAHFRDVLRRKAALLGFALSPDGSTVLAGYGDPKLAPVVTSDDDMGIYAADANDLAFTQRVPNLPVSCLRWTATGLFACAMEQDPLGSGPNAEHDFHVGLFSGSGLPANAAAFTSVLHLRDVRGPMPWTNGSTPCNEEWLGTCPTINACESTVKLSPGAIECGSSAAGAASTGGATNSGGAFTSAGTPSSGGASNGGSANNGGGTHDGGASTATSSGGTHAGGTNANAGTNAGVANSSGGLNQAGAAGASDNPKGCGCHLPGTRQASKRGAFALLALLAAAWTRVRRRHTSAR